MLVCKSIILDVADFEINDLSSFVDASLDRPATPVRLDAVNTGEQGAVSQNVDRDSHFEYFGHKDTRH